MHLKLCGKIQFERVLECDLTSRDSWCCSNPCCWRAGESVTVWSSYSALLLIAGGCWYDGQKTGVNWICFCVHMLPHFPLLLFPISLWAILMCNVLQFLWYLHTLGIRCGLCIYFCWLVTCLHLMITSVELERTCLNKRKFNKTLRKFCFCTIYSRWRWDMG